MLTQHSERLNPIGRDQNGRAEFFEQAPAGVPALEVIIDDQNAQTGEDNAESG
jgi:hypothetical protein